MIIAEAGVNHNGEIPLALRLIDVAAEAGADAVKFQTFKAERIVSAQAPKADYQKKTTDAAESQVDMIRRLELSKETHYQIVERCRQRGIRFMSTPFDLPSVDFLASLGMDVFKVPSGEITNLPLLRRVGKAYASSASSERRVILSTGMSTLGEVEAALDILANAGAPSDAVTLLHCTTEYPAPMEEVNLLAMRTMGAAFPGVKVGFSDHTIGVEAATAAVALGAEVIEKHFTLDRELPGPDHKASLTPDELFGMICAVRNIERAMGDGVKKPSPSEIKNRDIVRKCIVAATRIRRGDFFTEENLTVKRPGDGISPMRWDDILGNVSDRDYEPDEAIGAAVWRAI